MNDTIKNGGPAFPSTQALATASGVTTPGHAGLSLRDYFAAKAMQAYLSSYPKGDTGDIGLDDIAEDAYQTADYMLAARGAE